MRTSLTVIVDGDGPIGAGAMTSGWQACGWEVDVFVAARGTRAAAHSGMLDSVLARTRGDWLLFCRGSGAPVPLPIAAPECDDAKPVGIQMPEVSARFPALWGESVATAVAESCSLLVPRAELAAVVAEARSHDTSAVPDTVTELTLRLLNDGRLCRLLSCATKEDDATAAVWKGIEPVAAFRAGWRQGEWLGRYPKLGRRGAPGLAMHLLACCLLGGIGALLGRPLLLVLPVLFLALALLLGVALRGLRGRDVPPVRAAGSRLFYELPFACGQAARVLTDLSPADATARFDCDDRAVSPRFQDLVEALWCDHLALLTAIAILAPLV